MERLTSYKNKCKREMICRYEDCGTCKEYCPHINEENCHCLQEVLEKLAEYEDIGPTPEQLIEIDKLYAELCKELGEYKKLGTLEELKEIIKAAPAAGREGLDGEETT